MSANNTQDKKNTPASAETVKAFESGINALMTAVKRNAKHLSAERLTKLGVKIARYTKAIDQAERIANREAIRAAKVQKKLAKLAVTQKKLAAVYAELGGDATAAKAPKAEEKK